MDMPVFLEFLLVLIKTLYYVLEAIVRGFVPLKPKNIGGQTVLVTGGGRGIGRQLAIQFSAKDAKIALWDVDKAGLKETADDLKIRGATVFSYEVDVTDIDAVKQAADAVRRDLGDVDILVNNAGILNGKGILDLGASEIQRTLQVNTMAHFWTVREFLPAMLSQGRGHVVTVSSIGGVAGSPLVTDYCASKFAVRGLTEALAEEVRVHHKQTNIYTTIVCPMFVDTQMIHGENFASRVDHQDRFGKLLQPREVAEAVVQGVLRNQDYVFVPSFASDVRLAKLLPQKAQAVITDFIACRFVQK